MNERKRKNREHQMKLTEGRRVLGSDAARAVGRFRPGGPLGYRAKSVPDAPLRDTRAEAEADEAAWWNAKDTHDTEEV